MKLGRDDIVSDARGEVELEGDVLVIKRIHVVYHLSTPAEDRAGSTGSMRNTVRSIVPSVLLST